MKAVVPFTVDIYAYFFQPTFSYHLFLVVYVTYVTTNENKEIFQEKDPLNKSYINKML